MMSTADQAIFEDDFTGRVHYQFLMAAMEKNATRSFWNGRQTYIDN